MHPPLKKPIAIFAVLLASAAASPAQTKQHDFVPPSVISASDISYPIHTLAAGLVTLSIHLDNAAHVKDVQVLRAIPSLTEPALAAVSNWAFSAATVDGASEPSTLTVNIVFNPGYLHPQSIPLAPMKSEEPDETIRFAPAQVLSAEYAAYPVESTFTGAVVLEITVGKSGVAGNVSTVFAVPSLSQTAIAAAKKWVFRPGTLDEEPVDSRTIVAFVFRSPTITPPYPPGSSLQNPFRSSF